MRHLLSDLRYALRLLRRSPGFTLIAILTLAIGIGANTAIFSVLDAVLLRPLPYPEPARLAMIWEDASFQSFPKNTPAPANFTDWRQRNRSFADIAAIRSRTANLTLDGPPEFVLGAAATANVFSVLGVTPRLGRVFQEADDRPGASVVVLSYGLWQRRYGADPAIVGRTIRMNGEPKLVLGVMPKGFSHPLRAADFWIPIGFSDKDRANRNQHFLNVVGRLKPGVTFDQAQADLSSIAQQLQTEHPRQNEKIGAVVVPLHTEIVGDTRLALQILLAATGAILLIGCANLSNLLLSRASLRGRELAVRTALGAAQSRLIFQLITESLLLSLLGGIAGVGLAMASFRLLENLIPQPMTRYLALEIDARLLAFTFAVCLLTALLFGLAPAWQMARQSILETLKQGGRSNAGSVRQGFRNALGSAQIALAVMLVSAAGLLVQTLIELRQIELGFDPSRMVTMITALPASRYPTSAHQQDYYRRVLEEVQRLPGVERAAFASNAPFTTIGNTNGYTIDGQADSPAAQDALYRSGTSGYLPTIGARLRSGRFFDDRDTAASPLVVVVNETFVHKHFPDGNALGRKLRFGDSTAPWITIIGVVADIRERGWELAMKPATYLPQIQQGGGAFQLLVRTTGDQPLATVPAIREIIAKVDKEQPIFSIRTMQELLEVELAGRNNQMKLLATLAALALILAAIGIYGALSCSVTQRTREIGLRMALGATQTNILAMILSSGLRVAGLGLALGLAGAILAAQAMRSLLYGIQPYAPGISLAAAFLLFSAAVLACLIPAWRASRMYPTAALREE